MLRPQLRDTEVSALRAALALLVLLAGSTVAIVDTADYTADYAADYAAISTLPTTVEREGSERGREGAGREAARTATKRERA